jgi:anti-sigma factor RsiW
MTVGTTELTCRGLTEFLADDFAGELGPDERSIFDGHLGECPDCVVYLRSYADTIRLAKDAYDDDQVPAAVPERLVRAILEARKHALRSPVPRRAGLVVGPETGAPRRHL